LTAKSTDGGESWILGPSYDFSNFSVYPSNQDIEYGGRFSEGLMKSTYCWKSWTSDSPGLGGGPCNLVRVDPSNPEIVYAATFGATRYTINPGFFRSTDGGGHWTKLTIFGSDNVIGSIAFDPMNPSFVYADASGIIYRSTDRGETWAPLENDLSGLYCTQLVMDPTSIATMYSLTYRGGVFNGVFKSVDGGKHWTDISAGLSANISALAIDPIDGAFLVAGSKDGGVFIYP